MSTVEKTMEAIYASINNNNENIDALILELKIALHTAGEKSVEADPGKLAENNRTGRKFMQSYFRKRGVTITFPPIQETQEEVKQPAP